MTKRKYRIVKRWALVWRKNARIAPPDHTLFAVSTWYQSKAEFKESLMI